MVLTDSRGGTPRLSGCGAERERHPGNCGALGSSAMVDGPTPLAMWDPRVPVLSGGMRVIDQGPSFLSVTSGPAASPEQTPHLFLDPLLLLMKLAGSSAGTQLELALCAHRFSRWRSRGRGRPQALSQVMELGYDGRQVNF